MSDYSDELSKRLVMVVDSLIIDLGYEPDVEATDEDKIKAFQDALAHAGLNILNYITQEKKNG